VKQIQPFFMFKRAAEDAANFYATIFPNSKVLAKTYWSENEINNLAGKIPQEYMPGPVGSVKGVTVMLNGQKFEFWNGGSPFDFSMGISMWTNCETQEEIDTQYTGLAANGGEELDCGWVKDKFGVFWQVAPAFISEVMNGPDREKAERMTMEIWKMKKLDLARIKEAAGIK
jgi:predicted 3-demethylubiquinone-9 3-methyltransferase (glyoxalase superfamily)